LVKLIFSSRQQNKIGLMLMGQLLCHFFTQARRRAGNQYPFIFELQFAHVDGVKLNNFV
jgi:hypothetical protein